MYFVKIIILFVSGAIILNSCCFNKKTDNSLQVTKLYGREDSLGDNPAFQGGYINLGYWNGISLNNRISIKDRVKASENLYKLVAEYMNITHNDSVMEVGCGMGYGCAYIAKQFRPALMTCVDLTSAQIDKSKIAHEKVLKEFPNISFEVGAAHLIDKQSSSYDKIYVVEAAQHFSSMPGFAKEASRLLKPGGKLIITSHFSVDEIGYEEAKKQLLTVASGIDRMIPIEEVKQAFQKEKFKIVAFESIGGYVFEGFDLWLAKVKDAEWTRNIYRLYQNKNIDYYILVLEKPN